MLKPEHGPLVAALAAAVSPAWAALALALAGVAGVALASLGQVGEIVGALEGESDPNAWGLKLVALASIAGAAYSVRLALSRPSKETEAALRAENKELNTENRRLADLLSQERAELAAARVEIRMLRGGESE